MSQFLQKHGIHYAWVILIACMIFNGMVAGVAYNVRGLFYSAICAAEGWDFTVFSISTVIFGLCATAVMTPVSALYKRFPIKWVLFFSTLVFGLSFMARAFMTSVTAFCILSIFMGVAGGFLLIVPLPILINNWFHSRRGLALGLGATASGIGGAISSPIIASTIESMGWRNAALLNGGVTLAVSLPVILLFINGTPEEMGLKPYGAEAGDKEASASGNKNSKQDAYRPELTDKDRKRRSVAILLFVTFAQLIVGHGAQLPQHALSLGLSTSVGALATSLISIGGMTCKAAGGWCLDRFGIRKTLTVIFIITCAGLLGMTQSGRNTAFFYIGSFLIGGMTFNTTVSPSPLLATFASGDTYMRCYFNISRMVLLISAFGNLIPSLLDRLLGGYTGVCIIYAACSLILLGLVIFILHKRKPSENKH